MRVKVILGIVLLVGIGSYVYKNKYSFFKYLPAVEEEQLKNLNGKLCDENGKPFTGRTKNTSEGYLDIYSYKNGELDGLNVIYYKKILRKLDIGKMKNKMEFFKCPQQMVGLLTVAHLKVEKEMDLQRRFTVIQEK